MQRIFALPVGLGRVLNAESHKTLPTVPLSAPRSALTALCVHSGSSSETRALDLSRRGISVKLLYKAVVSRVFKPVFSLCDLPKFNFTRHICFRLADMKHEVQNGWALAQDTPLLTLEPSLNLAIHHADMGQL